MLHQTLQQKSIWVTAIIPFFLFSLLPGQRILASQLLINSRYLHSISSLTCLSGIATLQIKNLFSWISVILIMSYEEFYWYFWMSQSISCSSVASLRSNTLVFYNKLKLAPWFSKLGTIVTAGTLPNSH